MAEELSFDGQIKQNKTKFKAILDCYVNALDALVARQFAKGEDKVSIQNLESAHIVDVAMQLTAAAWREEFKPYDPPMELELMEVSAPKEAKVTPEEEEGDEE